MVKLSYGSAGERRAEARQKVFRQGDALLGNSQIRVHLLDVSAYGTRLHSQLPLASGQQVTIDCRTVRIQGVVRWTNAQLAGVRFDAPLAGSELSTIVFDTRPRAA